jgi:hypothetical protein
VWKAEGEGWGKGSVELMCVLMLKTGWATGQGNAARTQHKKLLHRHTCALHAQACLCACKVKPCGGTRHHLQLPHAPSISYHGYRTLVQLPPLLPLRSPYPDTTTSHGGPISDTCYGPNTNLPPPLSKASPPAAPP